MLRWSANAFVLGVRNRFGQELIADQTFKGWPIATVERPTNLRDSFWSYGGTARVEALWRSRDVLVNPHGSYTFTDGNQGDDPLPGTPKHDVKLGLDLGWKKLTLSTRVLVRGDARHPVLRNADGELVTIDGSTVVHLYARAGELFRAGGVKLSLWLDVRNLLDSRYHHVSANFDHLPGSPQDPLRVTLGLEGEL